MLANNKILTAFKISILLSAVIFRFTLAQDNNMHIVTVADSEYFPYLFNLIGSIHKVNFNQLAEISIYDIGFTDQQRKILESIKKVKVYPLQPTNSDMLTPYKRHSNEAKLVRGHYSWKPVAIKHALDMFDYVLYIDSTVMVMKPLDNLFKYIRENGYFFITCQHSIEWMTTKYVAEKLELYNKDNAWILSPSTSGLSANFQGLSRSVYASYVLPVYELSKDIRNFIDYGTTPYGYTGRHDQTLFSIQARLAHLSIFQSWDGEYELKGKKIPFHIAPGSDPRLLDKADIIVHGDHQARYSFKSYVRYTKEV